MQRADDRARAEAGLKPEGVFVVQLRSDSDLGQRRLRGRVEHVMSGHSVQFASLRDLLAFMNRYATAATAPASIATKKENPSDA